MFGFFKRKIKGLFTKEELIEYILTKDKKLKPKTNYLLVNEINDKTKRLIGIKADEISQKIDLFERVEINSKDIRNNFGKIELSNLDFSNLFLIKTCFNGDFTGTDFSWANFSGVNFIRARFIDTDFSNTDFSWANFSGVNFIGADFSWAGFNDIKLKNIKFDLIKKPIESNKILYKSKLNNISNLCFRVEEKTLKTLNEKQGIVLYVDGIPMGILKAFGNPTFISFQNIVNSDSPILIRSFFYSIFNSEISKILLDERLFIKQISDKKNIEIGDKDKINGDKLILNGLYKVEVPYLKVKLLRVSMYQKTFEDNIYRQILKFLRDLEKENIKFDKSFKIEDDKLIEIEN